MIKQKHIEQLRVKPDKKIQLKDYPTDWKDTKALKKRGKDQLKVQASEALQCALAELSELQQRLYADNRYALLIIFQAMDAAGKDGTIKHVMSGVNPQGCQVFSFKQPSSEELDHTFLWRFMKSLPERGRIGIFNRSYYEDVLVVKVHPELIQNLPDGSRGKGFWKDRYEDINAFEEHLYRNGTIVLKFFLHVSKDEQKKRFLERLEHPDKHWKFSAADLAERALWDDYQDAYADAISATSSKYAPWYIIPADDKWAMRALVAETIVGALKKLGLKYPEVPKSQLALLAEAREQLENE